MRNSFLFIIVLSSLFIFTLQASSEEIGFILQEGYSSDKIYPIPYSINPADVRVFFVGSNPSPSEYKIVDTLNKMQKENIINWMTEFCRSKNLEIDEFYNTCCFINAIMKKLKEKGINSKVFVKEFNKELNLTLMEKLKYPILVKIKKYNTEVKHYGQRKRPLFSSENSFKGTLALNSNVEIEILNSKTFELIDKITFDKTYKDNRPTELYIEWGAFKAPKILTDTRKEAFMNLVENFYNDFTQTLIDYDWIKVFNILKELK